MSIAAAVTKRTRVSTMKNMVIEGKEVRKECLSD
jgi:hypothetical protein